MNDLDFQFFAFPMSDLPFILLVVIIAFTIHEFAHAYFADKFGDPTPRAMGRVTLHPVAHLDFLGLILLLIAGFGWAKPVLVNRSYFKKPRLMSIIVSAAGPLSNLLLAFVGTLILMLSFRFGLSDSVSTGVYAAITKVLQYMIQLNLVLLIFNLIPIPPLDGYRIGMELLPRRWKAEVIRQEHWGVVIFLALAFIPPLNRLILQPLFGLSSDIFVGMHWLIRLFV